MLCGHVGVGGLQAGKMVFLHLRLGRFIVDVRRGGCQRLGFGVNNRCTIGTEPGRRHEASGNRKHVDRLVWDVDTGRRSRIIIVVVWHRRGRGYRKGMEERFDKSFLHFLEVIDVAVSDMSSEGA